MTISVEVVPVGLAERLPRLRGGGDVRLNGHVDPGGADPVVAPRARKRGAAQPLNTWLWNLGEAYAAGHCDVPIALHGSETSEVTSCCPSGNDRPHIEALGDRLYFGAVIPKRPTDLAARVPSLPNSGGEARSA